MELNMAAFYTLVAVTLALALSLFLKFRSRRKLNLPPGPKPWPVIGNLDLIGPLPHQSIHALSQKYGPLMHLRFGSLPVVVGSSVEMAKQILKTHDVDFAGRPKFSAGKYTTYNYSDITWSPYGPAWRQARKVCVMELFSTKRLDSSEYIRSQEVRGLLRGLGASDGQTVELKDRLATVSLNTISRMVLGKKYHEPATPEDGGAAATAPPVSVVTPDEFKRMVDELFLLNGVLNVGDLIPWIDFLDIQGYVKRMKAVAQKFDRFLEHVIHEHRERRQRVDDYVPQDMLDVLLQLADDPNSEFKLTMDNVKGFTQDMLAGGTESSAVTVEWAISELLRKPHIFKKATEELDRVIGRERWVEERDMPNLPYIEAIMKETMRLHPVAPMLAPRMSRRDCVVDGYDIPEGTLMFVSAWTIGKDPNVWDSPLEFRPGRFLGKDIDVKGQSYELLPFGAGRRMCPGYSLGLKVIQSTLANLLHGFEWNLPEGIMAEDLNMEEVFGLSTPRKVPLQAIPRAKLSMKMYEFE